MNEISVSAALSDSKDGTTVSASATVALTQTGSQKWGTVLEIATSATTITIPTDLKDEGITALFARLIDTDTGAWIDLYLESGCTNKFCRLSADGVAFCVLPPWDSAMTSFGAKADSADRKLALVMSGT